MSSGKWPPFWLGLNMLSVVRDTNLQRQLRVRSASEIMAWKCFPNYCIFVKECGAIDTYAILFGNSYSDSIVGIGME